ncbi:MAG: SCO family protein [Rubrivivax sp.]
MSLLDHRRALLLALAVTACVPARAAEAPPPLPGDVTEDPRPVPRWLLQRATDGRTLMPEALQGRFQLIAFGYATCPDVCPTTMAEMKAVLDRLGPRAALLQPLFVTVDPERDTLPVLREYTAAFDRRIIGLGGPPALVERAAQSFRVKFEKVPSPGGDPKAYTVDHSAGLFLVGPDGQLLSRLVYGMPVADLVARIERWMDAAEK